MKTTKQLDSLTASFPVLSPQPTRRLASAWLWLVRLRSRRPPALTAPPPLPPDPGGPVRVYYGRWIV